ncbi:Lrp/AsnC ligand binding domain-containing protein [Plantactinospora sp. DSM 117369]
MVDMTTYSEGPPLQALVLVRLPGCALDRFERFLRTQSGVTAGWHVVGDIDLVVHVCCPALIDLDRLVTAMRTEGAISSITHLVIGEIDLAEPADAPCRPPAEDRGTHLTAGATR